ncbi:ABC transporter ATP-binding protein [Soehngenia longivitae]|uniref:ABC transporter ATP-binding protein n=1 Tax=Soehngenia longivitae TaxID=2562294 RepID=A0A4Z0D5S6_9FIRM|nr:ABC transporter ATP-binding protein [Soehngenia longivitae]TFZ40222.1 ABC transporter ATP-binding protein [Soehngenia longivitae]
MGKIIEVNNLVKSFGEVKAVKGIDLFVEEGKLFAFLGPNGAGKSTTIDILSTLRKKDSGEVLINGYELGKEDQSIRNCIGVVFQDSLLDDLLTVRENLYIRGNFYGKKSDELNDIIRDVSEKCGIYELLNRKYGKLSGGQKRRCDIARALLNIPKILFLDEPTVGLDPQTRQSIWNTIRGIQEKTNTTVFMTTHYMEEASNADYIVVIDDGKIVASGSPQDLKSRYTTDKLIMWTEKEEDVLNYLKLNNYKYSTKNDEIIVELNSSKEAIPILEANENIIVGFEVIKGTLDDAFISITGKEIRE